MAKKTSVKKTAAVKSEPVKAPAKKAAVKSAAPVKAAPKAAAKKATPVKKAVKPVLTAEERYRRIEEAAYFLAEKNGFAGDSAAYWVAAEKQIDAALA